MNVSKVRDVGDSGKLDKLHRNYLKAQKELEQTTNKALRLEIKEYIDDLKTELGWILLDNGRFDEGLAMYKSLPWVTHGEAKFNGMSRALIEMGQYDEARKLLEKGLERFPESYVLWVARGVLDQRLGYDLESLRCFQFALRYAPKGQGEAIFDVASALFQLGHRKEALKVLQDLVKKYPDEPRYLVGLGASLLQTGYPKDAIRCYEGAIRMGYLYPDIYSSLCSAYTKMGWKKDAMKVGQEGLRRFPDDPSLYEDLAGAYFEMGWMKESRGIINQGLKKFPDHEGIKEMAKKLDEDMDGPDGDRPPLLGLILLMTMLKKKLKKK
jgi:predicted Zn-dependent protease